MATLRYETKGITRPAGKPKVLFTCHPADFDGCFRKVCKDLFRLRDCAVFYSEDLNAAWDKQDKEALKEYNLFLVPVTKNLLKESSRAMQDVIFAAVKYIPVLPIAMEPGVVEDYQLRVGGKGDFVPFVVDALDEGYEKTLAAFLDAVLADEEMKKRIGDAMEHRGDTPVYDYLEALSCLEGIGQKMDRKKGLALLLKAGDAGLPEAMERLCRMYRDGFCVEPDSREALKWAQQLVLQREDLYGDRNGKTLTARLGLAAAYENVGEYQKALELQEAVHTACCQVLGEKHPDSLTALECLAGGYRNVGEYPKAQATFQKLYALRCAAQGKDHPDAKRAAKKLQEKITEL